MTIEERARIQEVSQFSNEELERLHDLHGVNSPFGLGYYIGAIEQYDIACRAFCKLECPHLVEYCWEEKSDRVIDAPCSKFEQFKKEINYGIPSNEGKKT